ncbi:MAG TPA: EamA family transporter [Cyanobacteria bacterium UBA11149]|nr:EamA family transporter [Cyanobacteria bacterium UBA11367]HBE57532.1 EamA family transporter [Cyanobacteria bacterium UBA11366]HBK62560.1 EamA family transporter [Cyanobacteria bacterium UBA11166]HBR74980.1 EamA family transporter [Cyanobacteria bacterium UBA11159]HBS69582.1 EamA family transporter [Cyanobacteria bacterium UBA11153]HBW88471.1 EamA family transporter [Cyanobacteria bacterium UBA11149]HCA94801.1 EamA family transporter [Cyanobacteria bacterium UBA9226]
MLKLIQRIPGRGYLIISILIFAAASPITRKLTQLGADNLINGRNPISFCNLLFVGNLCALILLILIYGKEWQNFPLKQLSIKDWIGLVSVAILSGALAPALIFMALELTMVNNIVLIGRIEPPLILVLSVLLLKEKVNTWVFSGALLAFIGVFLTILLQKPEVHTVNMGGGFELGKGEIMAGAASISGAIATIISKVTLRQIPIGIFSIIRTIIGTIVFFAIALIIYGPMHFFDIFSPFLWQWMFIYSAVIVVGGQLSWFIGLKKTTASDVSLASSFSPIAGILAAYFILGEAPTLPQYIGGTIIIGGIALNQIGVSKFTLQTPTAPQITEKEMDREVGFKGI